MLADGEKGTDGLWDEEGIRNLLHASSTSLLQHERNKIRQKCRKSSSTRKFYMINGCISHPMHKLDQILSLIGGACGTHRSARLAGSQGV